MFVQWYSTVATVYPPALLLQLLNKCAHFAFSSHLLCTVLALTNAVQLPIPQLHTSVVLLLTVFDSVLCQTNATKLCYLFYDPYCIWLKSQGTLPQTTYHLLMHTLYGWKVGMSLECNHKPPHQIWWAGPATSGISSYMIGPWLLS